MELQINTTVFQAVEYVVVPQSLVGRVIGAKGRQILSYEIPYAVDIRLEKFFDSGDFQCTIKGSKSKEAIDGIVKKSPQCHNPQVKEVTSDQQVKCKSLARHKNSLFTV